MRDVKTTSGGIVHRHMSRGTDQDNNQEKTDEEDSCCAAGLINVALFKKSYTDMQKVIDKVAPTIAKFVN